MKCKKLLILFMNRSFSVGLFLLIAATFFYDTKIYGMCCCCRRNSVEQDDPLAVNLKNLNIILKNLFSPSCLDRFKDRFRSREEIDSDKDAFRRALIDNLLSFYQVAERERLQLEDVNARILECFRLHLRGGDLEHKNELQTLLDGLGEWQRDHVFAANILRTILTEMVPET